MSESPPAGAEVRFWHVKLCKLLAEADRQIGFAGVLRLLTLQEDIYAYAAQLEAGEDPEK